MKKNLIIVFLILSSISAFSENSIKIETLIDSIDWENCTESDLAFMFNDHLIKKNKNDKSWKYHEDVNFVIKDIKVGKYISSVAIPRVDKINRQLNAINIIFEEDSEVFKDINTDQLETYIENYLKNIFGDKYRIVVEYGWLGKECFYYWETKYTKGCGAYVWVQHTGNLICVSIKKEIKYSDYFID